MIPDFGDPPRIVFAEWPAETIERDWPDYEDAVRINVGSECVCHVGLTKRIISLGGAFLTVAGIGFVVTDRDYRHLGLMHAAMATAHRKAEQWGVPFALLGSGYHDLYRPLGYELAPNLPHDWMVRCFGQATWPAGASVNLRGTW